MRAQLQVPGQHGAGLQVDQTIDLKVRPIHHRLQNRLRANIFLCMLAYCVEWHLREAWRDLMFTDTEAYAKATRDPAAPARRSVAG